MSPSSPKLGLRKGHIKVFFRLKWYFGIRYKDCEDDDNAKIIVVHTSVKVVSLELVGVFRVESLESNF
ncbi:MAG: hypothetical protein ACKO3R_03600 [bacterium]